MSDPSNPFKSLADSLLAGEPSETKHSGSNQATTADPSSLAERIEAFFTAEFLNTRLLQLSEIGKSDDVNTSDFLYAVAEEDPDPLLRIAATIALLRLSSIDDLAELMALFEDEREDLRTYPIGLMLLDELPKHHLDEMIEFLLSVLPEESSNQASLIQLVRDQSPDKLAGLFGACLRQVEDDFESLDEEVWNELVYSETLELDLGAELSASIKSYVKTLDEDHPRRLDL